GSRVDHRPVGPRPGRLRGGSRAPGRIAGRVRRRLRHFDLGLRTRGPADGGGAVRALPSKRLAVAGGIARATGAALGAAALGALWQRLLRRPVPRWSGELEIEGIKAPVEIRVDRWGVPHRSARSREALLFGKAFCHARERLW